MEHKIDLFWMSIIPFVSKFLFADSFKDCRVQTPELAMWAWTSSLGYLCFCFFMYKIDLIINLPYNSIRKIKLKKNVNST